jgi:branched-chain amino acid transport system substrate-binding protein
MKIPNLRWGLAVLATSTLALAACSSSGSSGTGSSATGSSAGSASAAAAAPVPSNGKPKPTGTPIKLGVIYSTGAASGPVQASVPAAANAWASWVNDNMGGVNGHPVQVISIDDQDTGTNASAAGRQLVQQDKVDGIIAESQIATGALLSYLPTTPVPLIGGFSSSNNLIGMDNAEAWPNDWFAYDQSTRAALVSILGLAKASGNNTVAAAFCAEVASCAGAGAVLQQYAPKIGVDYTGFVKVAVGAPSYTAQCLQLISDHVDLIANEFFPDALSTFVQQCTQQGYTGKYLLALMDPSQQSTLHGQFLGVLTTFPWWVDNPPVQDFRAVLSKYAPGANYAYNEATNVWTGLELFRATMDQYGPGPSTNVTPADVTNAYHQVKNQTLDGLLPQPITYKASGPQPEITCSWYVNYDPSAASASDMFSAIPPKGASGNGATGDLASSCLPQL